MIPDRTAKDASQNSNVLPILTQRDPSNPAGKYILFLVNRLEIK